MVCHAPTSVQRLDGFHARMLPHPMLRVHVVIHRRPRRRTEVLG
jgi:hypothetical protein